MTKITYRELIDQLTDLEALTQKPQVGEKGGCFSSYDRASHYDAARDRYENWDANADNDGGIRKEGSELVVVELTGPGVIWRVWSAQPGTGALNIYLDGHEQADYSRPFRQFFEQITPEVSPAGFPSLCPKLSGGYNSFVPIPFNKSIKITFSKDWGQYYHFTYHLFPKTTQLPELKEILSKEGLCALTQKDRDLYQRGQTGSAPKIVSVAATSETSLFEQASPGQIEQVTLELMDESKKESFLQEVELLAFWDDQKKPAIQAKIGEFFGSKQKGAPFRSLPLGIDKNFYSNWLMPFNKAKIVLKNQASHSFALKVGIKSRSLPATKANDALRFHAISHQGDWKNLDRMRFEFGGDRYPDWPILSVSGQAGRFCGLALHVENSWEEPENKANTWWYGHGDQKSIDWWWGEGDEKFFVDGEKFPSTFGTGSEDYVGYAWAAEPPFALFDSAFANQSEMPLNGNGFTSVSRYQIVDNVPFQQSFEAFIEKYKPDEAAGHICRYQVVPYWYQEK